MLIFHDWQILVQTTLCFINFSKLKAINKISEKKKLKARKKDLKSRSHLKSREKLFVNALHVMTREFH